ncbi:MAG: radical SAM protein [Deltaproteobacteria bacterium]|jgi:uncharacterized Fe-S cluster-containing radical SAM superfamily protein|nr:radical SAM protein [Deltaproteobacteria bacterium]
MSADYRSPTYYELAAPPELDWRPYRPESYLDYRAEWARRGETGRAGDFPLHIDIDPTNRCNLRCAMCPRTYYLEQNNEKWAPHGLGDMDFSLFIRLIEEGQNKGLRSVKLNFLGEPLLYPKITDLVRLANDAGLWVMLNTNAVLLTERMSRDLLQAGLTDIFFSFDSPYKNEYEKIRTGADYDKVLANIARFMEIKEKGGYKAVQTRASLVLPADPARHETIKEDFIRLFRNLKVAEIGFGLPTVMGRDYEPENPDRFLCPDLFRRLFVYWDGVVGPCCGDWERNIDLGRVEGEIKVAEMWQSQKYRALREFHKNGQYKRIPACAHCSVPFLSTVEVLPAVT